jgi:hypothetical protein
MGKKSTRSRSDGSARTDVLAVSLLTVFTIVFFHRALWADCFVASDFHLTFQPLRTILAEGLRQGIPLWNDRLGTGIPLLANPMNAAVYLPNLLFAVFSPARTLTLLTVFHLFFGACGTWWLARRLDHSAIAAWVAALIFGFNGAAVSATSFANLSWSVAWLPWLLLTIDSVCDERSGSGSIAGLAFAVAALLVLGDPFTLLSGALAACLWYVATVGRPTASSKSSRSLPRIARLTGGTVAGLLLASPFLLAALRYVPASVRAAGFKPEGTTVWSFHPVLAINLIAPTPFGDPGSFGTDRFWASALFPEHGAPLLIGFYVGGLAACLAAHTVLVIDI